MEKKILLNFTKINLIPIDAERSPAAATAAAEGLFRISGNWILSSHYFWTVIMFFWVIIICLFFLVMIMGWSSILIFFIEVISCFKVNYYRIQVTDAYRIPTNLSQPGEFDSDSDPEPPPPPRLDYIDPPLSPRPSRTKRLASPISVASSTISSLQGRPRGSWTHDSLRETPASLPQCKIIPLNPLLSGSESETSELVNARYPYGIADESMDEWAMLDPDVRTYSSSRTTNPMLRKNQYWV